MADFKQFQDGCGQRPNSLSPAFPTLGISGSYGSTLDSSDMCYLLQPLLHHLREIRLVFTLVFAEMDVS